MATIKKQVSDPENYAKMCFPFESVDAANKALEDFHAEISELRNKYKITDVLIITKGSVKFDNGEIGVFIQHSNFGSGLETLPMAAYAFGAIQQENEAMISKLLKGKTG